MDDRLYVAIRPASGPDAPTPHPIVDGHFDVGRVYKVLGVYDAEDVEGGAHFVLTNPAGQIWFISQQHLKPAGLHNGTEPSIPLVDWHRRADCQPAAGLAPADLDEHPSLRLFAPAAAPAASPSYGTLRRSAAAE